MVCVLLACGAVLPSGTGSLAGSCPMNWTKATVPGAGQLRTATSTAAGDQWVAGYRQNAARSVAAHWDGLEWTEVPVVVDSGSSRDRILDADAVIGGDVWFVGDYGELGTETTRALVLRWTGATFEQVPVDAGQDPTFFGVDALADGDVWAVGWYFPGNRYHSRGLAAHWDGVDWTIYPVPYTAGSDRLLEDVTVVSHDDVWAVGTSYRNGSHPFIVHWDGVSWSVVKGADVGSGQASLSGVTDVGSSVIAVGSRKDGNRALVERWTGSSWVRQAVPSPWNYAGLDDVDGPAADRIWAVGYSSAGPLALRWNGSVWTSVPTGQTKRFALSGVTVLPSGEVTAAGWRDGTDPYAVMRCDTS
jgi:hypothetical protein